MTGQLVKNMAGHPSCYSSTSSWPPGVNMADHLSCHSRTSNWLLGENMAGHLSCCSRTSNWLAVKSESDGKTVCKQQQDVHGKSSLVVLSRFIRKSWQQDHIRWSGLFFFSFFCDVRKTGWCHKRLVKNLTRLLFWLEKCIGVVISLFKVHVTFVTALFLGCL